MTELRSFEKFFRDQYSSLLSLGICLTGDRATGEDVAQEAFGVAHRRWDEVSGYDRPGAFARRTLINLASNERRRRGRERRSLRRLASVRRADRVPGSPAAPAELDPIWTEVAALPLQQRAAIGLRYVDDLTTAEIADALGCSQATVRVHLHKAHRRLADRLGATYDRASGRDDEERRS